MFRPRRYPASWCSDERDGGRHCDLILNALRSSPERNQRGQPLTTWDTSDGDRDKKVPKHRGLRIFHGWTRELLALIFSSASLITIGILLIVYQGHPARNFPFGITLNGVVSILATAYKASLLYAISAALGQSKWDWYAHGTRRLNEFERIDEVSRGPLGAIRFLSGRTNKISIVSLAAIIVILALLIDSFSQQLVQLTQSSVTVKSDTVWTEVLTTIFDYYTDSFHITQTLNGAIWNNASAYDRKVHCPTGNCTFPPFKTIEWCSKTETVDVSRLSTNCSLTTYNPEYFAEINRHYNRTGEVISQDKTCGLFLDNSTTPLTTFPMTMSLSTSEDIVKDVVEFPYHYTVMDHSWAWNYPSCLSWRNISCPPLAVSYVSLNPEHGSIRRMEQSALTLCATEYEIVVNSGIQEYQATRSGYGRFRLNQTVVPGDIAKRGEAPELGTVILGGICFTSSYDAELYPPFPNDTDSKEMLLGNTTLSFCWSSPEDPFIYTPGGDWEWRLWWESLGHIFGNFDARSETAAYSGIYWNFDGHSDSAYGTGGSEFLSTVKAKGLREFMIGITASMNNAWRTMSQERVTGSYVYSETIFEISWAWFILPITLNVLSYIVLVSVIRNSMKTSQGKLWKGSTLASLYHGLQEDCIPGNVDSIEDMEKAAAMTLVGLKFVDKEDRSLLSK